MANDNYGIRADYTAHTVNRTVDSDADIHYWSPSQIKMASHYQYHVYLAARRLMRRESLHTVLDIGCGPAPKLSELIVPESPSKLVGLDEPGVISYLQSHISMGKFYPYDIERGTFPLHETFDLIISSDVIEHLVNPDKLLDDIKQAATPASWVVLSTPERNTLRGENNRRSPKAVHVREWNKTEFATYLASRGFSIVEHHLLPPLRFNWTRVYFRHWLTQIRAGRSFNTCQMVICKKV